MSESICIIGAGHNGLACAAYLARAGRAVTVLEARDRIGGACTLEETWPGYAVSPCAYLCGLLHPLVIEELDLPRRGFGWTPAESGLFVPFEDGECLQLWEDPGRCEAEIARVAPGDLAGWRAMQDLVARTREALRPEGPGDVWIGDAPSRAEIERRLVGDPEGMALLFEWSMAELLERYLDSERLHLAMLGQGVIGTNASPFDPGTASVHFHHSSGRMQGRAGMWGFVQGGMGRISNFLAEAAREAGAVIHTGAPVRRIVPGEGVEQADGRFEPAQVVISNADPATTLDLLGDAADPGWATRVRDQPRRGCVLKVTLALREAPNFRARPGVDEAHHRGQINTPLGREAWAAGFAAARAGRLPDRLWTELYMQTAVDPGIAPPGRHLLSIFAQYVPDVFAEGDWDTHRAAAGRLAVDAVARFCDGFEASIVEMDVKGPADIEAATGLRGGHIFHGSMLPDYMWDRRLTARTPMPGVYLCGAGTWPGGSVMGINGRNAAMAVLKGLPG